VHDRLGVLLDASTVRPEQAGVKTYALGLAGALARHVDLHVAGAPGLGFEELGLASFQPLETDLRDPLRRAAWRERSLGRLAGRLGADRVVSPVHELPLRRLPVPAAITIHDVGPLVAPALYGRARWLRYSATLPRSCRAAAVIVCVSEATRLDVHRALGVAPARMTVIGGAPQPLHAPPGPREEPAEPLFLHAGAGLPHKNLRTLAAAFARDDAPPGRLVLAGPVYAARERAEFERLQAGGARVEYRGFVAPAELARLYAQATCVVLPTLHEGFGMTVLEGFQAGVPVVASRLPVIEEVAGDAAWLVDRPLEPAGWAAALSRVAGDRALRRELVERGTRRLAAHTWAGVGERWAALLAGAAR